MFTDIVGYSAIAQRDEALALRLLGEQKKILRPFFPLFDGREIETIGDAFLVEFASALEATLCAVEIQKTLNERNVAAAPGEEIRLRIGLHVGDVVHSGANVHGDGVNIAARIQQAAFRAVACRRTWRAGPEQNSIPTVRLGAVSRTSGSRWIFTASSSRGRTAHPPSPHALVVSLPGRRPAARCSSPARDWPWPPRPPG